MGQKEEGTGDVPLGLTHRLIRRSVRMILIGSRLSSGCVMPPLTSFFPPRYNANMKDKLITKDLYLKAIKCPTLAWHQVHSTPQPLSIHDKFIMDEGIEVQKKARFLYSGGVLITGDNVSAAQKTAQLLKDPEVSTLFEATFLIHGGITRADIIQKSSSGIHLYEIKSGLDPKEEYLDDIGYTTMICTQAGLPVRTCSLILLNRDYRYGMPVQSLFQTVDVTEEAFQRAREYWEQYDGILKRVFSDKMHKPEYRFECRGCEYFDTCFPNAPEHHIFDLPRLSHTKFCQLKDQGIDRVDRIPDDFKLTANQEKVRTAIKSRSPYINKDGLRQALERLEHPLYFLDFETVTTALPLYEDTAPHTQILTQYSLHVSDNGKLLHHEYLADPKKDCRRRLAEKLIVHCGNQGSILHYHNFEKTMINGLIALFPDLGDELQKLVDRLVDLYVIINKHFYHPDFHGSYSIKDVLPVLVPELSYANMEIRNGSDAIAEFAYLARGKYSLAEEKKVRRNLLDYCKLDTMAMVKVWEKLGEIVE